MIPILPRGRAYDRLCAPREYGKSVLVDGWDGAREAEPKDFDAFSPPGGDQFRSTYWRLGSWPEPQPRSSETCDALATPWRAASARRPPPSPRLALISPHVERTLSGLPAPYLSTYMWDYSAGAQPPPSVLPPMLPPALFPPLRLVNALRQSELSGGAGIAAPEATPRSECAFGRPASAHRCAALTGDSVRLCCARAYRLPRYVSWDPVRQAHVLGMRPAPPACRILQAR